MARYFVGGGTGNWNSTTNWSATSGGASGASFPTSADDVFLDAASGANTITVNVASAAKTLTCTGFTGTLAMSTNQLTCGSAVFNSTMLLTGTNTIGIAFNSGSSITSNGHIFQVVISLSSAVPNTFTFVDDFNTNARVRVGAGTISGSSINLLDNGEFVNVVNSTTNGTTIINATGNNVNIGFSTTSINSTLNLPIVVNSSGTVTLLLGTLSSFRVGGTGSFTWTAGAISNINTSTTIISIAASSTYTLNLNGNQIANLTISGTTTVTNNSALNISNNLSYALGSVVTFAGSTGWTTTNFYILTANAINHTLVATKTYTVTTYFESITTTSSLKDSLISSVPGTKAIFTLNYGANQNVGYTNATDIDSSLGQTIWTFNGVVTTTNNWNTFDSNSGNKRRYIY